jgi:hypothetical protein
MTSRKNHPQVIRAKEMARAAGLDPYAQVEHPRDSWRSEPMYSRFMDAAFDEHFQREAVNNIYWDKGGSFYTDQWDIPRRDRECTFSYGRCRAGRRWFWRVHGWAWGHQHTGEGFFDKHGWADTEEQALLDGTAAIKRLAVGRRVIAHDIHRLASEKLKEINAEKRKARPPSDATDSTAVEYLYGHTYGGEDSGGHPVRFRIVKKTARRVYYLLKEEQIDRHGQPVKDEYAIGDLSDTDGRIGFVDRQKLEATGEVYNQGRHWCYADFHLHASLEGLLRRFGRHQHQPVVDDLCQLKAAMAAAHPDRGGSNAAFIEARERYVAARRQFRASRGAP